MFSEGRIFFCGAESRVNRHLAMREGGLHLLEVDGVLESGGLGTCGALKCTAAMLLGDLEWKGQKLSHLTGK